MVAEMFLSHPALISNKAYMVRCGRNVQCGSTRTTVLHFFMGKWRTPTIILFKKMQTETVGNLLQTLPFSAVNFLSFPTFLHHSLQDWGPVLLLNLYPTFPSDGAHGQLRICCLDYSRIVENSSPTAKLHTAVFKSGITWLSLSCVCLFLFKLHLTL